MDSVLPFPSDLHSLYPGRSLDFIFALLQVNIETYTSSLIRIPTGQGSDSTGTGGGLLGSENPKIQLHLLLCVCIHAP